MRSAETARRNLYTGKTYNSVENIKQFFTEKGMPGSTGDWSCSSEACAGCDQAGSKCIRTSTGKESSKEVRTGLSD